MSTTKIAPRAFRFVIKLFNVFLLVSCVHGDDYILFIKILNHKITCNQVLYPLFLIELKDDSEIILMNQLF